MAEGLPGSSRINVKGLRERLGMNQPEFAKANHVDQRTVRRWEHGYSSPSPMAIAHMRTLDAKHREQHEGEGESLSLHMTDASDSAPMPSLPRRRLPTV